MAVETCFIHVVNVYFICSNLKKNKTQVIHSIIIQGIIFFQNVLALPVGFNLMLPSVSEKNLVSPSIELPPLTGGLWSRVMGNHLVVVVVIVVVVVVVIVV